MYGILGYRIKTSIPHTLIVTSNLISVILIWDNSYTSVNIFDGDFVTPAPFFLLALLTYVPDM